MVFRLKNPVLLVIAVAACIAQEATFEGAPAIPFSNNRLQLLILPQGSSIASLVAKDDARKLNPLWNPMRLARESGQKAVFRWGTGHFLALDGFGSGSAEERAAGLPFHGEAQEAQWQTTYSGKEGNTAALTLTTMLPIVQERVERTFRAVDGEPVVYVQTQVESLLGFDRPVVWAEHATVGSPFLEPGVTVVDMPGARSQTRPYVKRDGDLPDRFASGKDFMWPWAIGVDGKKVDMRLTPANPNSGGHTTSTMDPKRKLAYFTVFNPKLGWMLGYLFKPEEFPWVQSWEDFPPSKKLARGLEFSTQPYDIPRREAIQMNSMLGVPTYRWLPAKSRITSRFLMFYTKVPSGFKMVDDVRKEGTSIVVEDRGSKQKITIPASLPL